MDFLNKCTYFPQKKICFRILQARSIGITTLNKYRHAFEMFAGLVNCKNEREEWEQKKNFIYL